VYAGDYARPSQTLPTGVDQKHSSRAQVTLETVAPAELFDYNTQAARAAFEAAAKAGMLRIVYCSSVFILGWSHDPQSFIPQYLPIDENHPLVPTESFGISKLTGEAFATAIAKNTGISVVSLRLASVAPPFPPIPDDRRLHLLQWPYINSRDVGDAFIAALQASAPAVTPGRHEAFYICSPTTIFQQTTAELLKRAFGDDEIAIRDNGKLKGNASIISNEKARMLLGFNPRV